MSKTACSLLEGRILDEYLGFEVHEDEDGTICAVPKFAGNGAPALCAPSVPLMRKRIWQWWHCVDFVRN